MALVYRYFFGCLSYVCRDGFADTAIPCDEPPADLAHGGAGCVDSGSHRDSVHPLIFLDISYEITLYARSWYAVAGVLCDGGGHDGEGQYPSAFGCRVPQALRRHVAGAP